MYAAWGLVVNIGLVGRVYPLRPPLGLAHTSCNPTPIPGGLIKLPLFPLSLWNAFDDTFEHADQSILDTWHAGRASHLVSLQWHSSSAWIAWKRYHRDKGLICNACSRQSMIYVRRSRKSSD